MDEEYRPQMSQALQVKTTACKAVALVTGCKPCSGQRPARWIPHQAGFKK